MIYDLTTKIIGLDNEVIMVPPGNEGGPKVELTLGVAIARSVNTPGPNYQSEAPDEKYRRGKIAVDTINSTQADFSAEDIVLIKKCVAQCQWPVVVFRISEILDPKKL